LVRNNIESPRALERKTAKENAPKPEVRFWPYG
jgi:hypothetical protein